MSSDVSKVLFVIEGGDSCGKTTQAKLLAETLRTRVIGFPRREEPSASPIGRILGKYLKGERAFVARQGMTGGVTDYSHIEDRLEDARVFQAMMTWDRYSCTDLWDAPEQRLVLSRYIPSGLVFGHLDGIPMEELIQAHRGLPHPRICFLLDLTPELQAERLLKRGNEEDRYERRQGLIERLTITRKVYRDVWLQHGPVRWPRTDWVILDASKSIEEIAAKILAHIPKQYLHPEQRR